MRRISAHRPVIIMVTASSVILAQGNGAPTKFQNLTNVPDAREIAESSIAATQRHWQARLRYTYTQREESRRLDLAGRVKSEDVDISRVILVNSVPFEELVEHNGQPPSADEERKQNEKLLKLKREMQEQRTERLRKEEEENVSLIREVPKAFDFQLVGDEEVNGRPAYVLQATPHPGYQAQGKYGRMFSKVAGKLWVDKQDFGWIKVDGQVIQPFSMGLFLARVLRGSHITMQQTRVDDGIWMPERIEVRAAAKIFFVKSLAVEQVLTYSDYRRPQASRTTNESTVNP